MTKGRKKNEINWEILNALVQFKVTKGFCADYLDISEDTIERRIKENFDMTFTEYNKLKMSKTGYKLQQKAISMALDGNTVMMIFALKNLANWTDKNEVETNASININIDKQDIEL